MDIVEELRRYDGNGVSQWKAPAMAADEIERLRAEVKDLIAEQELDEQRVADLMGDVNVMGQENERLRADDVALASDLDEPEIRRIAEQCNVRIVCGSLDGDWPALVRFARAIEQRAEWSAEICSVAERVNLLADIEDQRSAE